MPHPDYDPVLEGPAEGEHYLDWHTRLEKYRTRIRKEGKLDWPYAYDRPVELGGKCVECDGEDGYHKKFCRAVD